MIGPLSFTLHPTYTLHPTPYTLHPTPYTLHPTPCGTPHSKQQTRGQEHIRVVIPKLQTKILEKEQTVAVAKKGANPSTLYPKPSQLSSAMSSTTRWSTTPSSKVNLPHTINVRSLCGANLVTQHPGIRPQRNLRSTSYGLEKSAEGGPESHGCYLKGAAFGFLKCICFAI